MDLPPHTARVRQWLITRNRETIRFPVCDACVRTRSVVP